MILLCQDWRDVSERYASWHFSEKRFKLLRCEWWILGHLIRNSRPNYLSLKICDSFGKCGAPVLPCVRAVGGGGSSAPVWGLGRDFVPLRGASVATRPPCTTGCVSKHTVVICHLIDTVPVRVAQAPANLRHFFIIEGGFNITANVSWDAPLSDRPIVAYEVDWNQLNAFNRRSLTVSKVRG